MAIKIKKESSKLWATTKKISDIIDSLGIEYPLETEGHTINSPLDTLLYDSVEILKETKITEEDPNDLIPSEWNNLESRESREIESEIRNLKKGKLPIICYRSKKGDLFVIEGIRRVYASIHKETDVTVISISEDLYNKYRFTNLEWKWLILDSHSHIKITQ